MRSANHDDRPWREKVRRSGSPRSAEAMRKVHDGRKKATHGREEAVSEERGRKGYALSHTVRRNNL
jgi:hypothetical protein